MNEILLTIVIIFWTWKQNGNVIVRIFQQFNRKQKLIRKRVFSLTPAISTPATISPSWNHKVNFGFSHHSEFDFIKQNTGIPFQKNSAGSRLSSLLSPSDSPMALGLSTLPTSFLTVAAPGTYALAGPNSGATSDFSSSWTLSGSLLSGSLVGKAYASSTMSKMRKHWNMNLEVCLIRICRI